MVDIQEGLGEAETIRILRQLLLGLSFLHDRNIAHLDIKPQNILLTGPDVGSDVKLCDFGISRLIENGVEVREILGTPDYVGKSAERMKDKWRKNRRQNRRKKGRNSAEEGQKIKRRQK